MSTESDSLELATVDPHSREWGDAEAPPPPPPPLAPDSSTGSMLSTPLLSDVADAPSTRAYLGSTVDSDRDARWQAKLDAAIAQLQRTHREEMEGKVRELHALQRQVQRLSTVSRPTDNDNGAGENAAAATPTIAAAAADSEAGFEGASIQSTSGSPLSSSGPGLLELSRKFFPELDNLLNPPVPLPSAQIYMAASVFLYDSFHCRSTKHSTTLAALQAYQFIHVSRWKLFVRWIGWMHLLLGFIEPPSSIMTNGVRHGPSHLACGLIELVFLLIYSFHAYKQYVAYGPGSKGYWRSPWRTTKLVVLFACLIDVLVSVARNTDEPGIHLSQILRVLFVLEQSSRMRQLCSCMLRSLPSIISIMFLCFLHIAVFALTGYMFVRPLEKPSSLYPDESRLFFQSLGSSFQSIMILLTSANFPSVMLPSYRNHWFVCLFFVCFIMIGLYCLLQLTIAVVFHSFQLHTKDKLARALGHRERALQACFTLLSSYSPGEGTIDLDTWTAFIKTIRPEWKHGQAEILFRAATRPEDGASGHEMDPAGRDASYLHFADHRPPASGALGSDVGRSDLMDFIEFEQIVRFTQKSFQFGVAPHRHATPAAKAVAAGAGASTDEVGIDISMQSINSKGGRPSAASLAYPDPAVQSSPLHRPVVSPSALGSSDGSAVASAWGVVVPAFVLDYPAMASLAKVLIWYFNYRVPIPRLFRIHVLGRSEANIVEREEEEGPIDTTVAGPTPLEPVRSVRTQLTTFSLAELLVDLLTVFHAVLLITRLSLQSSDVHLRGDALESLDVIVIVIQVVWLAEMAVKLWLCRVTFFNSRLNNLDAATIVIIWVAQIVLSARNFGGAEDAVSCIRLARLFRLHHRLNSFTMLLQVLSQVGPALVALLGVLFILLYTYSMIGMWWFCNELLPGNVSSDLDYDQEDFYVLNFNDLAHSLIALFYQLVVNDWWIMMEAVVFRVGDAARIFFVSFYAISVLIVFSVCTAFVVEAYMDMHEAKVQASLKGKGSAPATQHQLESLSMPLPVSLTAGAANAAKGASFTQRNGGGSGEGDKSRQGQGGFSVPTLRTQSGSTQPVFAADTTASRSGGSVAASNNRSESSSSKSFRQVAQALHQKGNGPLQQRARQQSLNARRGSSRSVVGSEPQMQFPSIRPLSSQQLSSSPSSPPAAFSPPSASVVSIESLLLSRIRNRASGMGLSVRVRPHRGMLHSLSRVFGAEEDDGEEEPAPGEGTIAEEGEEGQDEKADE